MKKKMSFFRQLVDANYAFACQNSRGTRTNTLQGRGPVEHN
ncbi:hypothetical protein [Intestinibacillus sp. Marseille-P6563]|nr:hypothetical protein [Intestinibacillus sp. Marseille-P6563]